MPNMFRIYSGDDGLSHIEERPLPLEPFLDTEGAYGEGTPIEPAAGVTFRVSPAGYFLDWHNAPRCQYTINLAGNVQIVSSDGAAKRIGVGDILLAEDLTGAGHTTRVVGEDSRFYVVVTLPD